MGGNHNEHPEEESQPPLPRHHVHQHQQQSDKTSLACCHTELKSWIESYKHGYVHPSLQMCCLGNKRNDQDGNNSRGIFSTERINKGELLIRLPSELALSGEYLPEDFLSVDHQTERTEDSNGAGAGGGGGGEKMMPTARSNTKASPWLRCLAALMMAQGKKDSKDNVALSKHNGNTEDGTNVDALGECQGPTSKRRRINETPVDFAPYLNSLPIHYETLLNWSDDEISTILAGTTLSEIAKLDREQRTLQKRFESRVRPYLQQKKIIGGEKFSNVANNDSNNQQKKEEERDEEEAEKAELERFKVAIMCLSTRGFHLRNDETMNFPERNNRLERINHDPSSPLSLSLSSSSSPPSSAISSSTYTGPFLLPYIDLLNHDFKRKCTTLKRDAANKTFYMTAERDINPHEEICHSYGDTLNSGQLLQTFGFVTTEMMEHAVVVASEHARISMAVNDDDDDDGGISSGGGYNHNAGLDENLTPAMLSRRAVMDACASVTRSSYPQQVRKYMQSRKVPDEIWDIPDPDVVISSRDVSTLIPDEILVVSSRPLSEELITLGCINFLPQDAYDEWKLRPALLDRTVLDDYFLGKLVCRSILIAVDIKLSSHKPVEAPDLVTVQGGREARCDSSPDSRSDDDDDDDAYLLSELLKRLDADNFDREKVPDTLHMRRIMYGLTVRLEEKACLKALREQVVQIMDSLDDELSVNEDEAEDMTMAKHKQK